MVPQTLAVNFLRLASFSSLPPPVGMVLAPSLYIAGVIHGGIKRPTLPPPLPPHAYTLLLYCVIFSKILCSCQVSRPGTHFQIFWIPSCDCQKQCIMVKPPVCDVWSGRLPESNHAGGGGGKPFSEKRTGHTFSRKKIY